MALVRRRAIVRGQVQGVFYRDAAQREAERLGVAGWARNLGDGTVEVVAEGEPDAVDKLMAWAWRGSRRSVVTGVEVAEATPEGLTTFRAR